MKCDTCENFTAELPDFSQPYGSIYCTAGCWCGMSNEPGPEVDPWADCIKYEHKDTP